jgi:hypothetical protein
MALLLAWNWGEPDALPLVRTHFVAMAARLMRRILVDAARFQGVIKSAEAA